MFNRLSAWAEAHPRRAWLLAALLAVLLVLPEALAWPLQGYPGALWHKEDGGADIEVSQAAAEQARWPQVLGYFAGRQIAGNGYWRPLASLLYVVEFRLWGRQDVLWCGLNFALYLLAAVAILATVATLARGSRALRLGTGLLAVLFWGGPGLADRNIGFWVLGWWPAQPELLSLLCALAAWSAAARYGETGAPRWAWLAGTALLLGVGFKEMGYVGVLGAAILLWRTPKGRRLLLPLACGAIGLFLLRLAVVERPEPISLPSEHGRRWLSEFAGPLLYLGSPAVGFALLPALPVALVGLWLTRKRRGLLVGALVGFLLLSPFLLGAELWLRAAGPLFAASLWGLVVYGLARRAERPVPELALLAVLTCGLIAGYPLTFGWYRLWPAVLLSWLAALGVIGLCPLPRLRR